MATDKVTLPPAVLQRLDALEACGMDSTPLRGEKRLGIAFSGGGIRSATISLGIAQVLARYRRLLAFDYMSTVSGGGYFGSFLRSLYVPNDARGPLGCMSGINPARFEFAEKVLRSEPHHRIVIGPGARPVTNPIWWLRDYSRYLAPNGPTDFLFAISHMARNWIAMIYVFVIAVLGLVLMTTWTGFGAAHLHGKAGVAGFFEDWGIYDWGRLSLLAWPALAMFVLSLAVGVSFWMTEGMHDSGQGRTGQVTHAPPRFSRSQGRFVATVTFTVAAAAVIYALRARIPLPEAASDYFTLGSFMVIAMLVFAVLGYVVTNIRIASVFGISPLNDVRMPGRSIFQMTWLTLVGVVRELTRPFRLNPTADLRQVMTKWLATLNAIALVLGVAAGIDTAGIYLAENNLVPYSKEGFVNMWEVLVLPGSAFLISKMWGRLPGTAKLPTIITAAAPVVIGSTLFAATAILAAGIVHRVAWTDHVYGNFDWSSMTLFSAITAVLVALTGLSVGFINLSSLHGYYAARLTRAYIGATNVQRLENPGRNAPSTKARYNVSRNERWDYIDSGLYQAIPVAAPIHLINVTLNDTIGGSSMVDRARKGALMTFGPEGVFVGARNAAEWPTADWPELTKADTLTIGQLAAISGAAASTGMGRLTTLGGALTLTYANIRTGYWWWRGKAFSKWPAAAWSRWWNPLRTYFFLWKEMTATYARQSSRWYLSDGGHYENSGVLDLVRRGCALILAADNGCDPKMEFSDLEILIRTARLDLGRNIAVASQAEVLAFAGVASAGYFFNGSAESWRKRATEVGGTAFALLLNINKTLPDGVTEECVGQIIWMKPHFIDGMSADVQGYAVAHADFPHETTGDQFFDEAQWESYRRMGIEMAIRLLGDPAGIGRHIPEILRKPPRTSGVKPARAPRTSRSPSPPPAPKRSSPA